MAGDRCHKHMIDKNFIEKIKVRLEGEKQVLEEQLREFAKKDKIRKGDWDSRYPNFHGSNLEEEADEVEQFESLIAIEHTLENKLNDINTALEKIGRGGYGSCEKCQADISPERLDAIPETKICDKCKK